MARTKRKAAPISQVDPSSAATEAYHTIRTNLQSRVTSRDNRVIQVTSANRGEGKTQTATNLAVVLAQSHLRVLLVDANMRAPDVHARFGVGNESGLTPVLLGEESKPAYIEVSDVDGLFILPTGPKPANPAATLSTDALPRLLRNAREEFDLVIIDGPPVLGISDALILAGIVDGIVFVVDSKKTNRVVAQRAISAVQQLNRNVIGGIVNRIPKHVRKYSVVQNHLPTTVPM